jgi:hypothetical protein
MGATPSVLAPVFKKCKFLALSFGKTNEQEIISP